MLAPDQIEFYHAHGYLALENIFGPDEINELRAVTDDFVEQSRSVTENTDVFDLEPTHTPESPRLRRLKNPINQHEVYRRALIHPGVLGCVEQLIGKGLHTNGNKLNMKIGDAGSPVEWHQDWAFYPHTNDDLLAVGIYLDDSTVENGALLVIPDSHRGPILDHHQNGRFVGAVTDPDFDPADAVPINVPAGGISIHHVRTLHGSAPNRFGNPRRLLLFQYCAIDAWPLIPGADAWKSYTRNILRGEPVTQPRLVPVPVQLPLPKPASEGSIYETQRDLAKSRFA